MFRDKVTVLDAVVVVTLMESSMLSAALISADNALHSSFPRDPMTAYLQQGFPGLLQIILASKVFTILLVRISAELVLNKLKLEHLLAEEIERVRDEATRQVPNLQIGTFATHHKERGNREAHIAQTQRMLVNIQRQNQEEEFVHERDVKKRKNSSDKTRVAKRLKTNNPYDGSSEDSSESDVNEDEKDVDRSNMLNKSSREDKTEPSLLESPEFTSTHRDTSARKLSIFKYSEENSDEDDSIFEFS